jgi:aspartate racemase
LLEYVECERMNLAEQLKIPGQKLVPLVIGGIGTESAIPYMRSLLRQNTTATKDQDHLGYLMLVASTIPDRTEAILKKEKGDDSQYNLITNKLEEFATFGKEKGFGFMVTLCNTIHAWREDVHTGLKDKCESMGIPWISIMEAVGTDLKKTYPEGSKIAILATTGTLHSRLYHNALEKEGFSPVSPDPDSELQHNIMDAIYDPDYGIKAKGATGQAVTLLLQAMMWAENENISAVILGCTEIPLAITAMTYQGDLPCINPLDSLAKITLERSF